MRTLRVCTLVVFAILSAFRVASAADLTGIYVVTFTGGVEYFNLTDQGAYVTGYLQSVSVNTNSSDGVNRQNYSVSGSVHGSRAVMHLASGSSSYQWTADIGWSGFTVSIPMQSGEIKQVYFRRSSVTEVNRLVGSLTQSGNSAKYYANAQAELVDSQQRLSNDLNYNRPKILNEIRKAKADLAKALQEQQKANQKVAAKKTIAAQKHAEAEAARQAAQTNAEQAKVNELETDANLADTDVRVANTDVTVAGWNVNYEQRQLQSAKDDLRQMDARIAQLHGMIANDKRILRIP